MIQRVRAEADKATPSRVLSGEGLAEEAVRLALAAGADAADALAYESASLSAAYRLGKIEDLERSESRDLGLRVFIGQRQAFVSSTDWSERVLADLVSRAVSMARIAPEDPYCGLADAALLADRIADLDLADPQEPSAAGLLELAKEAESAALAMPGITNSEGGGANWSRARLSLATSHGFAGQYAVTRHSVGCTVLAGEGPAMERDYDYHSARFAADLRPAAEIGHAAAERVLARVGARAIATRQVPVIFDPRVSGSLLGHFAGAISGAAIARGTSFLKDRLGERVFAEGIAIHDDPLRRRGLASRPFDGEGMKVAGTALIEDGRLTQWLLDSASARQLGLTATGHAVRGTGGPPSPGPSNLYLAPGADSPEALIGSVNEGLYVTDLIGMGVNGVTGDYSRGAAGMWIENGELAYPVNELTIAGNLNDMYARLTPASDLVFRFGTNAPTLRVDGMTVAGPR